VSLRQENAQRGTDLKVTQSKEGALDRFNVVAEPTGDKSDVDLLVLLADPGSKLIQEAQMFKANKLVEHFIFTYGDPKIESIYDVGVPREAKIVDAQTVG